MVVAGPSGGNDAPESFTQYDDWAGVEIDSLTLRPDASASQAELVLGDDGPDPASCNGSPSDREAQRAISKLPPSRPSLRQLLSVSLFVEPDLPHPNGASLGVFVAVVVGVRAADLHTAVAAPKESSEAVGLLPVPDPLHNHARLQVTRLNRHEETLPDGDRPVRIHEGRGSDPAVPARPASHRESADQVVVS